jgi:hypothetical protein
VTVLPLKKGSDDCARTDAGLIIASIATAAIAVTAVDFIFPPTLDSAGK